MTISMASINDEVLFPEYNPILDADERMILNKIISYLETTSEDSWCVDIYRSADGTKNCVLGHIQKMMDNDATGMELMERFENTWGNSMTIGRNANDGLDTKNYPQSTAKARSIAYIENLLNGMEDSIVISMEKSYQAYLTNK